MKLGAARKEAGRAWHLVDVRKPEAGKDVSAETFAFALRPVFHRVEAHVFLAFVGYCLLVTVHLLTSDGRELVLPRHTQLDDDHRLLLHQLGLRLPQQPPPRIRVR